MKYTLFVGRWQPFHSGHKYIIDSFVNNGKPVCIAIRDTERTIDNPFSPALRKKLIKQVYKDNPLVKVITIPDIDTVVVGRGVGYAIMEAPEDIQRISGTKVRENKEIKFNEGKGLCVLFTGLPSSGKTTTARNVAKKLYHVTELLDGDEFRKTYTPELGYTKENREKNIRALMKVARNLTEYGLVVLCSFIAPYESVRREFRETIGENFLEVYIKAYKKDCRMRDPKDLWREADKGLIKNFTGVSAPYEEPENPDLIVDTSSNPKGECARMVIELINNKLGEER